MNESARRLAVRVYFEDTDAGGIAYHTAYLRFAERGRTEYLRACGFSHAGLRETAGGGFAVRSMTVDYLAAARLDDELQVTTRAARIAGASVTMEQTVERGGAILAALTVRLAFVAPGGRALRLPAAVRRAFDMAGPERPF